MATEFMRKTLPLFTHCHPHNDLYGPLQMAPISHCAKKPLIPTARFNTRASTVHRHTPPCNLLNLLNALNLLNPLNLLNLLNPLNPLNPPQPPQPSQPPYPVKHRTFSIVAPFLRNSLRTTPELDAIAEIHLSEAFIGGDGVYLGVLRGLEFDTVTIVSLMVEEIESLLAGTRHPRDGVAVTQGEAKLHVDLLGRLPRDPVGAKPVVLVGLHHVANLERQPGNPRSPSPSSLRSDLYRTEQDFPRTLDPRGQNAAAHSGWVASRVEPEHPHPFVIPLVCSQSDTLLAMASVIILREPRALKIVIPDLQQLQQLTDAAASATRKRQDAAEVGRGEKERGEGEGRRRGEKDGQTWGGWRESEDTERRGQQNGENKTPVSDLHPSGASVPPRFRRLPLTQPHCIPPMLRRGTHRPCLELRPSQATQTPQNNYSLHKGPKANLCYIIDVARCLQPGPLQQRDGAGEQRDGRDAAQEQRKRRLPWEAVRICAGCSALEGIILDDVSLLLGAEEKLRPAICQFWHLQDGPSWLQENHHQQQRGIKDFGGKNVPVHSGNWSSGLDSGTEMGHKAQGSSGETSVSLSAAWQAGFNRDMEDHTILLIDCDGVNDDLAECVHHFNRVENVEFKEEIKFLENELQEEFALDQTLFNRTTAEKRRSAKKTPLCNSTSRTCKDVSS
ncbi:hypothetical protein EYF80_010387 [Liparis tanakae]|uniref:Uncharacterized protein n=1 Tax=Liparis tanakae TaxID=230148 RepID=A0A4Z2IQC5_9TELE|nr:hypothetical protein EYF80_010387 [Liparis tanakae]